MSENSKEGIINRMLRNASGIWGYSDTQDINSFDPIVEMIICALAEEIYNVTDEIKRTDARIVEKLYELLFNQNVFTHLPAHAVVTAKPTQPQVIVSESYQFSSVKKVPKTINEETVYNNKTIFFTPTTDHNLLKGEIKYFAAGNQLYEISDHTKESLANVSSGTIPDFSKLYIGLKLDSQIERIDGLSFMFLVHNKQHEERFYNSIADSRWKINNLNVSFRQGFEMQKHGHGSELSEIFRNESDNSYRACTYVNDLYKDKFMITENNNYFLKDFIQSETLPEDLKRKYPLNVLKSVPKDIFWVEVQLSQPLSPEITGGVNVFMNCFPVINRELNEYSQLLTQGINIMPLTTDDMFFDIKMITDTNGTQYKPLNSFSNKNSDEEGFMIRQGGIARFDSRDATETIKHLIDLLRDERARYASLGTDLISSELKQLDQILSRLEKRLEASDVIDDSNSYVMLQSKSDYERATIQFWSTSGDLANDIKSNSRLSINRGSDLDNNSVFMVTTSFGGRQKLSKEEKLNKLRRTLLSKGRIVTMEDIKALCFELFGSKLLDVQIKKGVHLDPSPEKGLVRSLDIYLKIDRKININDPDLEQKTDELKVRLKQESINLLPFRIFTC
jgi:hypothetical protein